MYILSFGLVRMRTFIVHMRVFVLYIFFSLYLGSEPCIIYVCLVLYFWRDFVLYISPFGVLRMRTLHCVYESCGVFVEWFCFVYLAFRFC